MDPLKEKDLIYVTREDDLKTLLSCFKFNEISHIPVVDNNKLVGLVSKTDLTNYLYLTFEKKAHMSFDELSRETMVKEIMTQPIVDVSLDASTIQILEKFIVHNVGSVVIKDGDKIAGILTEKDMLHYFAKTQQESIGFTEKLSHHIVQWLDQHGIIKISKMLSDIGI